MSEGQRRMFKLHRVLRRKLNVEPDQTFRYDGETCSNYRLYIEGEVIDVRVCIRNRGDTDG